MEEYTTPPNKDPELWELAKKRAGFKSHLSTYLIIVPFFWVIWYLTGRDHSSGGFPWAIWPTVGWGVGLFFHFMGAYVFHKNTMVDREYDKLLRNKKN